LKAVQKVLESDADKELLILDGLRVQSELCLLIGIPVECKVLSLLDLNFQMGLSDPTNVNSMQFNKCEFTLLDMFVSL
jgi:hypothetical protein